MLSARLATGLTLIAAFLLVLLADEWLAPWYPLWLGTVVVVVGLAAWELSSLLGATGARPAAGAVFGGVMALIVANWLPHILPSLGPVAPPGGVPGRDPMAAVHVLAWPLWGFAAVVMLIFIAQSVQFQRPGTTVATIAGTVLAVAYVGLLGSFIVQFRWLDGPYHGVLPLVALVAAAKGADTGAYTAGRLFGRHKLWPRLSPNKTVEGAVGGLVLAVAASVLVAVVARTVLRAPALDLPAAVGFGLVVGLAAQLGDLMESMIKRDCAAKDASATLPGFGGVLDVLDSLLFAGPVAYGYWIALGP